MDVERRIDGFLAKYSPAIEADLRAARAWLRDRFPHGYELVFDNYNALVFGISPTDKAKDAFLSIAGYPRWVTLFFSHGAALDDPHGVLEGEGKRVRGIRLKTPAVLDAPAVGALVDQATAVHADALSDAPRLTSIVRMVVGRQRPRRPDGDAPEEATGSPIDSQIGSPIDSQIGLQSDSQIGVQIDLQREPHFALQDPSVSVTLAPMTDADYADYLVPAIRAFADDKVRSGQWARRNADDRARRGFADLLPDGRATAGHELFTIRDGRSGVRVGFLWIAVDERADEAVAYVYDVTILSASRRRGYGTRAFEALDRLVAERGLGGIALHVFGHNAAARAFYDRLGFATTNLDLFKPNPAA